MVQENVTALREGFVEDQQTSREAPERPGPAPAQPRPEIPRGAPPPRLESPPAPLPGDTVERWPLVVRLWHKPIINDQGQTVSELTFREPRAGDINRYGNP